MKRQISASEFLLLHKAAQRGEEHRSVAETGSLHSAETFGGLPDIARKPGMGNEAELHSALPWRNPWLSSVSETEGGGGPGS